MADNSNFGLNFDLGETAEMIRATVSAFAQAEIAPRADGAIRTRSRRYPKTLTELLAMPDKKRGSR